MTSISVILPVRDGVGKIERQLGALATQRGDHSVEVIVADHGSHDDSARVAKSFAASFGHLDVVDVSGTTGPGGARNAAVDHAQGHVLAFCDCDDVAHPAWLEHLVAPLEGASGLVAGHMLSLREGQQVPPPDLWRPEWAPSEFRYMDFLPFADTANMAVRRADFILSGGFDPSYLRSSDIEYSWRSQLEGIPLIDAPQALVAKCYPASNATTWAKCFHWGRHQPRLYRQFRSHGIPTRPIARSLRDVLGALVKGSGAGRVRAVAEASGLLIGRYAGSARWRVWYP